MKVLALDTTANVASVAIVDETKTIGEFTCNNLKNHSQTIMPMVDQVFAISGLTLGDMDYIACSKGPGSFTGLRIGAATAKGLAHGAGKKIIPVPTLDALAYNMAGGEKLVVPVMDARRNQVYTALFQWENGMFCKLTDDMAADLGLVLEMVRKSGKKAVFLGDGSLVFRDRILEAGYEIGPPHANMQRAGSVGALAIELARRGIFTDFDRFVPEYLRVSQAERELQERQRQEVQNIEKHEGQ